MDSLNSLLDSIVSYSVRRRSVSLKYGFAKLKKRYVALCLTVFSFRDRLLIANNDQNDVIQTDMVVMELLSF